MLICNLLILHWEVSTDKESMQIKKLIIDKFINRKDIQLLTLTLLILINDNWGFQMGYRPCGVYHQLYRQDHAWWQTKFVWGK